MKTKLTKWNYDSNYIGEDYSDYYIVYSQYRDSDTLSRSNFRSIWEDISKFSMDDDSVQIIRSGHWAVGWVETILVHPSNKEAFEYAEDVMQRLQEYGVYDENDWCNLTHEEVMDYWNGASESAKIEMLLDAGEDVDNIDTNIITDKVYDSLYQMLEM